MMALVLRGAALPALLLLAGSAALGQDFRVGSTITSGAGKEVTRATTWFHAGKAFDNLHTGNQMTIYEPARQRFVILDSARGMAAEYDFEAMQGALELAHSRAEKKLRELQRDESPAARKKAAALQFWLHPKFEERDQPTDASRGRLTFKSEFLTYTVDYVVEEREEQAATYLAYADWAARLNYFVSPSAQFPDPRLEVNAVLRKRRLLPKIVKVQRKDVDGRELNMASDHFYRWTLDGNDLETIRSWDKKLLSPGLKWERFEPHPVDAAAQAKR